MDGDELVHLLMPLDASGSLLVEVLLLLATAVVVVAGLWQVGSAAAAVVGWLG